MDGISELQNVDIQQLRKLETILEAKEIQLSVRELEKLDQLVDEVGLDKNRGEYFALSRALLTQQDQLLATSTIS